jgi:hypothetical protein
MIIPLKGCQIEGLMSFLQVPKALTVKIIAVFSPLVCQKPQSIQGDRRLRQKQNDTYLVNRTGKQND